MDAITTETKYQKLVQQRRDACNRWRKKNVEKARECVSAYYKEHREEILQQKKEYYVKKKNEKKKTIAETM